MAMTAQGLADAITAEQGTAQEPAVQNDANLKIATAIINYLKAHAEVPQGIPVATTGSPAAQTGSTTAAGTLT